MPGWVPANPTPNHPPIISTFSAQVPVPSEPETYNTPPPFNPDEMIQKLRTDVKEDLQDFQEVPGLAPTSRHHLFQSISCTTTTGISKCLTIQSPTVTVHALQLSPRPTIGRTNGPCQSPHPMRSLHRPSRSPRASSLRLRSVTRSPRLDFQTLPHLDDQGMQRPI